MTSKACASRSVQQPVLRGLTPQNVLYRLLGMARTGINGAIRVIAGAVEVPADEEGTSGATNRKAPAPRDGSEETIMATPSVPVQQLINARNAFADVHNYHSTREAMPTTQALLDTVNVLVDNFYGEASEGVN